MKRVVLSVILLLSLSQPGTTGVLQWTASLSSDMYPGRSAVLSITVRCSTGITHYNFSGCSGRYNCTDTGCAASRGRFALSTSIGVGEFHPTPNKFHLTCGFQDFSPTASVPL